MRSLDVMAAVCACTILPWAAVADQAKAPVGTSVIVTPIFKADHNIAGQPIVFPQTDGEITATLYEFPPGAVLPIHKHPYQRIGYVLSGTVQIENEGSGKTDTLKTGGVLLESVNQWHRGKNIGDVPVRMLVIDLAPKGAQITIPKK